MQTLSLEMCRLLSSIAPGFEGHYGYYRRENGDIEVLCTPEVFLMGTEGESAGEKICPAWQVEDVLRNAKMIFGNLTDDGRRPRASMGGFVDRIINVVDDIAEIYLQFPDTAYQKIEEYLWSVLK